MSEVDIALADQAVQKALENARSGAAVKWHNDTNGAAGSITPLRTYRTAAGVFCRDYREVLTIGSASERYRDTACRSEDGLWKQPQ